MKSEILWTALATVSDARPVDEGRILSPGVAGAVVRIIALAFHAEDFEHRTKQAIAKLGLQCDALEEIMEFALLTADGAYSGLAGLAESAQRTRAVEFGTFHSYYME